MSDRAEAGVLAALDLDHRQFEREGRSSLFGDAADEIRRLRAALTRVAALADLYDEAGRMRTVKPPWAHIATEVRNAARVVLPPGTSSGGVAE